jgi:hypothetical protein
MQRPRRDRWLSMAEVAGLMKLGHKTHRERRQYVRRVIRGLERRDGTSYLRRFGPGNGKLYIAVSALEQLMPWDPGTLTAIRGDVDGLGVRMKRAEKRIDGHDRDIAKLRAVQAKAAEFASAVNDLLGQKAS